MSFRLSAAVVAVLLAGCAPSSPIVSADGPASTDLPTAPLAVGYDLPPVAPPRLPVAIRTGPTPATAAPRDHAAMGHAMPAAPGSDATDPASIDPAMDHAAMGHSMPAASAPDHAAMGHGAPTTELTPTALAPVVDAILALHAALVAGDLAAGQDAAGALAASVVQAGLGHEIQAHAVAADAATDLDELRAAIGRLGPPMVALVEAVGAPPGMELSAFRCGMADAPQGGVWIQATPDLANPLLAGMTACGRRTGGIGQDAMDHGAGGHETGQQHD